MRAVYVDTGVWVAFIDKSDAFHPGAVAICEGHRDWPLVCSEFVLSETVTFLRRKSGAQRATEFGRQVVDGRIATLLRSEPQDWAVGLSLIDQFPEQRLSFTDATSIALLRRFDITKVAAFDKHFSIVAPEREILSG